MKTNIVYEPGDKGVVVATREHGLCTDNVQGGTESVPVGKPFLAKVIKTWFDYEIGRRYVSETKDGRKLYFGDFGVKVKLAGARA